VCVRVCVARSGRGSCRRGKEEERKVVSSLLLCLPLLPPSLLVSEMKEEQAEILLRFTFTFRFS
jgi:hypothetical protein